MLDVQERFLALAERRSELRWYALVDGYQFEQHTGDRPQPTPCVNRALFQGTEDEPLAHAGPWLYDLAKCPELIDDLAVMEQALPAVSWLMTAMDLEGLAQFLQLKLDAVLPDGRKVLIRFYDPRVLGNLIKVMDVEQRAEFFFLIEEWHFIYNDKRVWMGRGDA
jgi:hypothetical protein